jgi:hypothetical protein
VPVEDDGVEVADVSDFVEVSGFEVSDFFSDDPLPLVDDSAPDFPFWA